jgi:UDPglucose 6-dehydrogenase
MKIAVVGTGYVGLVTGTCFAETGNDVMCVDIDAGKVQKLSNGQITIYEPGLEKLFLRNLKEERLKFTTDLEEGVKDAVIIFLALPTPPGEDGSADLKYVLGVAEHLGKIIKEYKVIIDKSTVPVGTAERVRTAVAKNYAGEVRCRLQSRIFARRSGGGGFHETRPGSDRHVFGQGSEGHGRPVWTLCPPGQPGHLYG